MCGIVGGVADRDVVPVLLEGLRRLEYRGYDSAGLAVLDRGGNLRRLRTVGKVRALEQALEQQPVHNAVAGRIGLAHTRWATHGVPSERNAHPHVSRDGLAIVHNGIIENHERDARRARARRLPLQLRDRLRGGGAPGAFSPRAAAAICSRPYARRSQSSRAPTRSRSSAEHDPERLIVARVGCPVVLGLGVGENFVASDVSALLPVTRRFIFLEEGDVAEVRRDGVRGDRSRRPPRRTAGAGERAVGGSGREGSIPPLHAQGNPRAAARGGRHAAGAGCAWPPARGRVRTGRRGIIRARARGAHRRLRYQLPRGRGGGISDRSRSAGCPAGRRSRANTVIAGRW